MRGRALAVVLVVALLRAGPAGATTELDDARRRANEVAAELAEAQSRLAELEVEIATVEARAADAEGRRSALEQTVRTIAVDRFMQSTPPVLPMVEGDLNAVVRANALAGFVTRDNLDAVDEFRQASEDSADAREDLADLRAEAAGAVAAVRQQGEAANAELGRLQRLDDERRAREEADRRAREESERRAAAAASAAQAPGQGAAGGGGSPPGTAAGRAGGPAAGAPRAPAPAPAVTAGGDWICPVQGPRAFSNDWGQPRSGGRRHQGNDILSPRGTPVVASVAGNVRPHSSSLGGISYYLSGDDGNTYFGTHLDSLSGASGSVDQGEVLGYVGNSGNASGGPTHLHFEIHPGGGSPVNPYPTLARYC